VPKGPPRRAQAPSPRRSATHSYGPQLLAIERAWLLLVRSSETTKMNEAILSKAKLDLDRSAYPILARIDELGPTRIRQLADELHLDPSTVSRQLKPLVAARLLASDSDATDNRASVIRLTRSGERALQRIRDARHDLLDGLLEDWNPAELDQLEQSLTRLAHSASTYNKGRS
jgi:DNA-binding MarR family transcriptional regulator